MKNTSISYLYRDANNYKASRRLVLKGCPQAEDLEVISAKLDEDLWFIPSQVGLEDLQGDLQQWDDEPDRFLDEDGSLDDPDHAWHELRLPDSVEETSDEPDVRITWEQLVEEFRSLDAWDESNF